MDLKRKVMGALGWSVSARLVGQLVSWAVTIIVVRLLAPESYGLMAMAMMFVALSDMFSDLGMGSVLVQLREAPPRVLRQLFGLTLIVNTGIFGTLFAAAPVIATFFAEPELVPLVRVLAIRFLLLSFEVMPRSLLERDLDFKRQSMVMLAGQMIGAGTTLTGALYGMGVWALVAGYLATATTRVVGVHVVNPLWILPSFRFRGASGLIRFGGLISIERALAVVHGQLDQFIIGKLLGKQVLGFYSVAMHLAELPMARVMGTVNPIAFSAFARLRDEPDAAAYYTRKIARISSLVAFPAFFGISAVADPFVEVFLGHQWHAAAIPLQFLVLVFPLRLATGFMPSLLRGLGYPGESVINVAMAIAVLAVGFLVGTRWGLYGVSMTWVVVYPLIFCAQVLRVQRITGVGLGDYVSAMAIPALNSSIMYAAVTGVGHLLGPVAPALRLGAMIATGAAVVIPLTLWLQRGVIDEIRGLIRPSSA